MLTGLPQLHSLDFVGRDGESSANKEVLADIPGLFIDWMSDCCLTPNE